MAEISQAGKVMRFRIILISMVLGFFISACTSFDFSQREVQQGTLLPQSKIDALKLGLSKVDVAKIMGTSLMSPMFNDNRWDYAYTLRKGNHSEAIRHLALYFKNNALTRIEQ